jgi:hypothetical protein
MSLFRTKEKGKYTVYFEIFGKKMKYMVEATSEDEARSKIVEQIIFHKVVKNSDVQHAEDAL